jgi:hypothetical protein
LPIIAESSKLYGGWSLKYAKHIAGKINAIQSKPGTFDRAGLEARVVADQIAGTATDPDAILEYLTTNAAIGLMYGRATELSIGYGRRVDNLLKIKLPRKQKIKAGARLKILKSSYNQTIIGIDKYIKTSANGGDVGDEMQDDLKDLEKNHNDTTIGIDIGAQFQADKYQAGVILRNLNSPSIPIHDTENSATGFDQVADKEIELKPQLGVDGAYYITKNKEFIVAGSLDLNKTENLSNSESQWMRLGVSYKKPNSYLIPGVRASYSKNMAGSEIDLLGVGFTLFKVFNLDLATGKDGDKQAYAGSLGLEFFF